MSLHVRMSWKLLSVIDCRHQEMKSILFYANYIPYNVICQTYFVIYITIMSNLFKHIL